MMIPVGYDVIEGEDTWYSKVRKRGWVGVEGNGPGGELLRERVGDAFFWHRGLSAFLALALALTLRHRVEGWVGAKRLWVLRAGGGRGARGREGPTCGRSTHKIEGPEAVTKYLNRGIMYVSTAKAADRGDH